MANTKDEIRAVRQWKAAVLKKNPTAIISWCVPDYPGEKGCFMVSGRVQNYPQCPECDYIKGIATGSSAGSTLFDGKLAVIKQKGFDAFYNHKSTKACDETHPTRIAAWMKGWNEAKEEYDASWSNK